MKGTVFNIQRFSLYDGPGIRTVVFLKGCPLSCIWCHNPEGKKREKQVLFNENKCIGCMECASVCPENLHRSCDGYHVFMRGECRACGKCTDACCSGALSMAGREMTADEVMSEVLRDLPFYGESGGGLTLSGGEPLMQGEFSVELLRLAREAGISTCVETCGFADTDVIRRAAKYTDVFYFDYKATDEAEHRRLCGVGLDVIMKNLSVLDEVGANVTLRCPIVPGANYTPEHILGIAETAKRYSCVREIHLEPYHDLGVSKSAQLGEESVFSAKAPQRDELTEKCDEISKICNKSCIIS